MKKKIRVFLNETIEKIGEKGSMVNVSPGFARNFLVKKKRCILVNRKNEKGILKTIKNIEKINKIKTSNALKIKEKINKLNLEFLVETKKESKIFGSITKKKISDLIKQKTNFKIREKNILIDRPIKKVGIYKSKIKIYRKIDCTVTLNVISKK
jgi:large subunit ribosomal protein L9